MKRMPILFILLCVLLLSLSHGEATVTGLLADGGRPAASSETAYVWPAPNSRHLTSGFGKRKIALYGTERLHTGLDINTAVGDPVLAIAEGTVLVSVYDGGWGEYILIHHGDGLCSLYAHLDSRTVHRGDTVTAGQQIGTSGNSGLSSGPHLHFELRENGTSINPFRFTYE